MTRHLLGQDQKRHALMRDEKKKAARFQVRCGQKSKTWWEQSVKVGNLAGQRLSSIPNSIERNGIERSADLCDWIAYASHGRKDFLT